MKTGCTISIKMAHEKCVLISITCVFRDSSSKCLSIFCSSFHSFACLFIDASKWSCFSIAFDVLKCAKKAEFNNDHTLNGNTLAWIRCDWHAYFTLNSIWETASTVVVSIETPSTSMRNVNAVPKQQNEREKENDMMYTQIPRICDINFQFPRALHLLSGRRTMFLYLFVSSSSFLFHLLRHFMCVAYR